MALFLSPRCPVNMPEKSAPKPTKKPVKKVVKAAVKAPTRQRVKSIEAKKKLAAIKAPPVVVPAVKTFRTPYFAHQTLDPTYFPYEARGPLGPAPNTQTSARRGRPRNAAFDESSDEEDFVPQSRKRAAPKSEPVDNKRLKIKGGRPAIAKKVTANLDSDDELIVRMKNAKYLEKDIVKRLIDEGRIAYHHKTIGTRWARLKKVLQVEHDKRLDAELTDWHDGDDDVLRKAVDKADKEIATVKAKLDARRWQLVADHMKNIKPVTNFSQNACRNRLSNLRDGTAKPTPESLPLPDENALASIQRRKDKEAVIDQDEAARARETNIAGNRWVSKKVGCI